MTNQVDTFPASNDPPENPIPGWMWYSTQNDTLYMYLNNEWLPIVARNPQSGETIGKTIRRIGNSIMVTFPPDKKKKKEEKKTEKPKKQKIRELMII